MPICLNLVRLLAVGTLLTLAGAGLKEARAQATANGREVVLHKWSGALNVPDPVACAVDPQGRVYVAATTRRKVADLDIREHPLWIPDDVALTSVSEKSAFLKRELAPGKLRQARGGLKDHNLDGSIDWKDLTVHSERIYQLRDRDGDGTADHMTVFAEGFNTEVTGIAAGVLYHDGWVYATIAPDLWRFKDTDDDGVADVREIVVHGFGVHLAYAGHDMHGLCVGPDGRIYWSIGDKGVNATSREGRSFIYPNEGCILRIEPDGSGFEVFARGLRNPQEPAFDALGDLFAVDNDADMKGERERFVAIIEGSDSGWRCNYQYMKEDSPWMRDDYWKPAFPGQSAHLLPPLASYSDGPAGFKADPGTALGEGQRGLFLLNEFPSGKLKGFRIEQDGASHRMVDARLLNEGVMGIGMSWHPDGSLYFVDWIGGYPLDGLGAIWRVDTRDERRHPARAETQRLLAAGFSQTAETALADLLAHADQRVRLGAQFEAVRRGRTALLLAAASNHQAPLLARLHGLWGYGQSLRRGTVSVAPIVELLRDADGEVRAQAAKVIGDTPREHSNPAALLPILTDSAPRARLQAVLALGKLGYPAAVDPLLALAAREADDPVFRHAIATGLAGSAQPIQLAAQRASTSPAMRLVSVVALRRQGAPEVQVFLDDPDRLVAEEAARAIHDERSIPDALPALAARLTSGGASDAFLRRALNANLRLGTPEAAARLLAFGLNPNADRSLREQALDCLRLWNAPPSLDRVDGYARTYRPAPIGGVLSSSLDALLAVDDAGLKTRAIEIMIAHRLTARPVQLANVVTSPQAPGALRAQTLRLLAAGGQRTPDFERALKSAFESAAPVPLAGTALELIQTTHPDRFLEEVRRTLNERGLEEKQHAFALMAKGTHPQIDAMIEDWGADLLAGKVDPSLRLDVLEAISARQLERPSLAQLFSKYQNSRAAASQDELLLGGDAEKGRDIVANHLNANCLACHAVTASGSEVGPNLRSIGLQRSRPQLLESLVSPSATIATGYGIISITLSDGSTVGGTLARETTEAITLRQFDGNFQTFARSKVTALTPPISIMPPMLGILQPREVRDVVAYLSSLTHKAQATKSVPREGTE